MEAMPMAHPARELPIQPLIPQSLVIPMILWPLPPGFTSERYLDFITAAEKVASKENALVIRDAAQLTHEHYTDPSKAHDMHNIVDKTYFVASAVLSPREVPEVQAIMRLCNEFEMPVWPFSIGRKYAEIPRRDHGFD
jgi:hypothetical protein